MSTYEKVTTFPHLYSIDRLKYQENPSRLYTCASLRSTSSLMRILEREIGVRSLGGKQSDRETCFHYVRSHIRKDSTVADLFYVEPQ